MEHLYCKCESRWRKYSWKHNGLCMKHLYNDESLIVRLKKKLAFFFLKKIKKFNLFFHFSTFYWNINSYKALVITLHYCNSLRCKLTHMGFELELRFTYTCTLWSECLNFVQKIKKKTFLPSRSTKIFSKYMKL